MGDPSPSDEWWNRLNKRDIKSPDMYEQPVPKDLEGLWKQQMGEKMYSEFQKIKKGERQRVWDAMRDAARERMYKGEMPDWFDPKWLDQDEAPPNQFWREQGIQAYQNDDRWLGTDSGSDGGNRDGRNTFRWWREDDPYWPLRDWGDHPMRWWTIVLALVLAVGGVWNFFACTSVESLQTGFICSTLLLWSGLAMSDTRSGVVCDLGVKLAWATCAFIAIKEYFWGWQVKRRRTLSARTPSLGFSGATALLTCVLYMTTGMSGLYEFALPMNPGGAFRIGDVAKKQQVWEAWGYGAGYMKS